MTRKSIVAGLLVVGGAGAFAGFGRAELPRHTARPAPLPGIPCYDYRVVPTPTPTVTAVSLTKVPAGPVVAPTPVVVGGTGFAADAARAAPVPQMYQLLETRLKADHCYLSRVAVAFHADGAFQITFRADQNPQVGDDIRSPLRTGDRTDAVLRTGERPETTVRQAERADTVLQTGQLRRNQFVVRVRGYASYPAKGTLPALGVTPPALVEFPIEPFWVRKGEPYSGFVTGRSDAVRKYFTAIDRIEVEFTYR